MRALRLLIVHHDDDFLDVVGRWFDQRGFMVMACETASEAISAVERVQLDVAIVDCSLGDSKFSRLVPQLKTLDPSLLIWVFVGGRMKLQTNGPGALEWPNTLQSRLA